MLKVSDGYKAAVIGVSRQMLAKAVVELVDPDISYTASNGSGAASWSKPEQLYDKVMATTPRFATLEPGRWPLDGKAELLPNDPTQATGQIGHVGDVLCGEDGIFGSEVYAELKFSNVSILQACSVFFSTDPVDGIPVDFRVSVMQGETAVYTKEFTGNAASMVSLSDFTVNDPTSIRVYATRWSLGRRRLRVMEIIPGLYEEWSLDSTVSLNVQMRGNFADLALPYGTCDLRIKNTDRRFEPYIRTGIFRSIEERQAIPISVGPLQEDGSVEYASVGVFYQRSGGWDIGQNDMYIDWRLVDICGLLAERDFQIPATLPTTLGGWFACFAEQLGSNFANRWHVDPAYANLPVTVNSRDHLRNRKCGALIRFACMATGTWPRADQATGKLTAEPLWSEGSKIKLNQIYDYPRKRSNDALAALTFKLYDGTDAGTLYTVSGNSTSSSKTLSIDNPFIHTAAAALTAARQILSQYGGIKIETNGRGNPVTEIGDVDTIWINDSEAKTARRMEQSFQIRNGILQNCRSIFLQADGSFMYENSVVLTGSGTWTPPAGVTQLRVVLGQGAQGSTAGQDGRMVSYDPAGQEAAYKGEDGVAGVPGKIWHGTISVNAGVAISYHCGAGTPAGNYGDAVALGEETTFGAYTSANGRIYENGYTDIASGNSYGRAGVKRPIDGTSDAGPAGVGGQNEVWRFSHLEQLYDKDGNPAGFTTVYDKVSSSTPGTPGVKGADGFIVIYWDKEAET